MDSTHKACRGIPSWSQRLGSRCWTLVPGQLQRQMLFMAWQVEPLSAGAKYILPLGQTHTSYTVCSWEAWLVDLVYVPRGRFPIWIVLASKSICEGGKKSDGLEVIQITSAEVLWSDALLPPLINDSGAISKYNVTCGGNKAAHLPSEHMEKWEIFPFIS